MSRRIEKIIGYIGIALTLFFLGGISLVIMNMELVDYQAIIVPIFETTAPEFATDVGYEMMRSLSAWFGVTAFVHLFSSVLGIYLISKNRNPKIAGVCFTITGLIVLFGSQLIAYPLAFIFFIAAAFCFLRKEA